MKSNTIKRANGNITRERLLSSILRINRLLSQPVSIDAVLNAIVRETQIIFGLNRVAIFMINNEARLLEAKYLSPDFTPEDYKRITTRPLHLDKHACRETLVVKTGKTVYIKDPRGDHRITLIDQKMDLYWKRVSTISAPLRIKKEVIGVMEGDRHDKVLNLTRSEVSLFTYFANQASIIIENAKLQSQNQKKIDQLLLLEEATRRSSATFDRERLLEVIVCAALRMTKAKSCHLFMPDEKSGNLVEVQRAGKVILRKEDYAWFKQIVENVASTGKPQLIHDLRKELHSDRGERPSIISQLAVAIFAESRVLGVISVCADKISAFRAEDLEILSILASHAAVLIRNILLYEQVKNEKDRAENILESSPNGVITIDVDGYVQSINRKAEQILDISRTDMLGKSIAEIKHEHFESIVNAALNEVPRYGIVELTLPKQNGDTTILEVATTRVKSLDWKQLGVILTIKDVTEPKKTEEIIRRMDRYSSLGQLSAGIAHEIRNPLASINFNIQLLSMELPLNDQQRRLFADMSVCVDRIKILVKSMLDFAKPSPPEFNRGRIEKVLDHCIGMMHAQIQKRRIRLDVQIDGNIPEITFDSHQIEQVFINILLNAMEAVPEGGDIIIRLKPKLNASDGKSYIVVSMRDTGGGILSEHMPRIFDPFFTTKPDGTGLGLSIVHKILEQHHSTIEVSSDPQGGTTVTLKFTTDDMKR